MRKLKTKDLFTIKRILRKAENDIENNFDKVEDELCEFLADLSNKTKEEIEFMDLSEFIELFNHMMNSEGVGSFFKPVGQSTT